MPIFFKAGRYLMTKMEHGSMTIRQTIIATIESIAETNKVTLVAPLTDDTELLKSGLDSMGFAVLVARLEEILEFDPFTISKEPVYPRTLGEFISFYEHVSKQDS